MFINKFFQKKIEEINSDKILEINSEFLNAFSLSKFFDNDDKEDLIKEVSSEYSKKSTNSVLTNDDSFEREISDEEDVQKCEFISRKRIRKEK